jgi:hypothetical protein
LKKRGTVRRQMIDTKGIRKNDEGGRNNKKEKEIMK